MQQFLVLFREPDGRKDPHTPEEIADHRKSWNLWSEQMNKEHRIIGGMPLTLSGRVLHGAAPSVIEGPHKVGDEIIGGYLLINAHSLEEATSLMQSCPIFEFGGYAEIRETMTPPGASSAAGPASSDITSPIGSTQEQNKATVRRFNTAFIQDGDISAFHEIIDPAIINHTAPAGFSKGADGIFDVIELFRKIDLTSVLSDNEP